MNTIRWLLALTVPGTAAAGLFIYTGAYNIGADAPHHPITVDLIETLRDRSIAARTKEIDVPADLHDNERVRRGAGNYEAMCTNCHLKPGIDESEIRMGLYPQPPNLATAGQDDPASQFWVIKHGIKMTAMPGWGQGGMDDASIWDMVALLQVLPDLTEKEYQQFVAQSDGHSHAGAAPASSGHHETPAEPVDHHGAHPHESVTHETAAEPAAEQESTHHHDAGSKPHAH